MAKAHIAQAVVFGQVQGQDYRNVMHFGTDADTWDAQTDALLLALAAAMMECFVSIIIPGLSNEVKIDGVRAKRIWPAMTDEVEDNTGAAFGAVAGQCLPSFNSQLIDIKTGGGGRKWRGRMFLPPPLETHHQAGNVINPGTQLLIDFAACVAGKFIAPGNTTVWHLGVLSRANMAQNNASIGASFREAKSLGPKTLIAVQRRRKIGKGS